jgi:hypothetical protein
MIDAFVQADLGGSDELAVGGALAYHYGMTGSFTGVDVGITQDILRSASFGSDPQPITCSLGGTPGAPKLS